MKLRTTCFPFLALIGAVLPIAVAEKASAVNVSLELALVVDESGSVNTAEWTLQRNGYVNAFRSAATQNAIIASGGIAVTYIQFDANATTGLPWTHLFDVASIKAFADSIEGLKRFGDSGTGVANAIQHAVSGFGTEVVGGGPDNGFTSTRQIIDVSGDGRDNQGGPANKTDLVTTAAIANGIDRVNGIVISPNGEANLLAFYQNQVQDGANSFTLVADDFDVFAKAVNAKIVAEITDKPPVVPEAGRSLLFALVSLVSLAGLRRRWRRTAA